MLLPALPYLLVRTNTTCTVSRAFCDPALGCTVEQYNRGTIAPIFTLAKPAEGIPADDAWTPWPGYPKCLGLGDNFATSLCESLTRLHGLTDGLTDYE